MKLKIKSKKLIIVIIIKYQELSNLEKKKLKEDKNKKIEDINSKIEEIENINIVEYFKFTKNQNKTKKNNYSKRR